MDMRILIISLMIPFFLGVSSQAGLLDTKTLPGTQPQTPVGAQQVPRGRVRTKEGQRISPGTSVIRNLMRFIDGIGVYLVGAISVMLTKRNQRLGDLAAGTIVVRHKSSRAVVD